MPPWEQPRALIRWGPCSAPLRSGASSAGGPLLQLDSFSPGVLLIHKPVSAVDFE